MTRECTSCELHVSEWLDGEIGRDEAEAMLDHLVRCAGCRRFFREGRALGGLIESLAGRAVDPAPEHLWDGIAGATARGSGAASWRSRALRLAAVLVVAAGLAVAVVPRLPWPGPSGRESAEIEAGAPSGAMTDERFIALAAEVLEADARYQRAMYRAMEEILDELPREGGREERRSSREPSGEGERSGGRA